jgi:hypothetical protein
VIQLTQGKINLFLRIQLNKTNGNVMEMIKKGTWVEIQQTILQPEQRAASLPEETRKVPYVLRVSGFLQKDGQIGQEVVIKTIIGREMTGKLIIVNPSYTHSFGKTVPELLTIGTDWEEK